MKTRNSIFPRRGEVYLVNFDPTIGAEIKKIRPALVIQNDIGNQYSSTIVVAAITGNGHKKKVKQVPVSVLIADGEGGLTKDSLVLLGQIRTIDKRRLGKRLGAISAKTMNLVDKELRVSLELQ